jgi:hypothetical protein
MHRFLKTAHVSLSEAQANGKKPAKKDAVAPLHNAQMAEPPARRKRTREERSQTPPPGTSRTAANTQAGKNFLLSSGTFRRSVFFCPPHNKPEHILKILAYKYEY